MSSTSAAVPERLPAADDPDPGDPMTTSGRPHAPSAALALFAVLAAIDIAGPLLPESEGDIAFGVVAAVLLAIAAYGVYAGRGWGYRMGIVLAALHVLSDGIAVFGVDDALIRVAAAVAVVVALALLVVLLKARSAAAATAS
jgi:uncharacterized RDD family membrane protein YckC